jgi:prepilin-type N-terminal cleavage/methylation domain-containing protein
VGAFTLIELIVVLFIVGIVLATAARSLSIKGGFLTPGNCRMVCDE